MAMAVSTSLEVKLTKAVLPSSSALMTPLRRGISAMNHSLEGSGIRCPLRHQYKVVVRPRMRHSRPLRHSRESGRVKTPLPLGEGGRRPVRPVPNLTPLPLGEGGRRPGEGPPITLPLPFIAVDTGLLATRFPHPNPLPEGEGVDGGLGRGCGPHPNPLPEGEGSMAAWAVGVALTPTLSPGGRGCRWRPGPWVWFSPQPSPRGRRGSFDTAWNAAIQGRRGGAPAKLPPPHPAWIPAFAGMTCSGFGASFAPIMESRIPGCLVEMTPRPPVSVFLPRGSCPAKAYSLSSQALLV